jgi:hypothetical protein
LVTAPSANPFHIHHSDWLGSLLGSYHPQAYPGHSLTPAPCHPWGPRLPGPVPVF